MQIYEVFLATRCHFHIRRLGMRVFLRIFATVMNRDPLYYLEKAGVKPTSNRILVMKALLASHEPMSLIELEKELETLERSSILRVLTKLLRHDAIHIMEDGRGISKYEACRSENHDSDDDSHAHFYCEKCHKVFCLEDIPTPSISLPDGYETHSVNFMIKGICPECSRKRKTN